MFNLIGIDQFIEEFKKTNPDAEAIRESLAKAVRDKANGAKCLSCGRPIWAIGSAVSGWNGCFSCISLESENSEDYEIDSVCFD